MNIQIRDEIIRCLRTKIPKLWIIHTLEANGKLIIYLRYWCRETGEEHAGFQLHFTESETMIIPHPQKLGDVIDVVVAVEEIILFGGWREFDVGR